MKVASESLCRLSVLRRLNSSPLSGMAQPAWKEVSGSAVPRLITGGLALSTCNDQSHYWTYGWPGHKILFLCNRLNHARCDRRGLFSIHTKYGLLNRRPTKVSFFNFD